MAVDNFYKPCIISTAFIIVPYPDLLNAFEILSITNFLVLSTKYFRFGFRVGSGCKAIYISVSKRNSSLIAAARIGQRRLDEGVDHLRFDVNVDHEDVHTDCS